MSAMSDASKGLTVPKFSGKESKYHVWSIKFQTFMATKGLSAALKPDPNMPSAESGAFSTVSSTRKAQEAAVVRNMLAVGFLVQSFQGEYDLSLATKSMTEDWPSGQAHQIINATNAIHRGKSSPPRSITPTTHKLL